jgi:hypothetical protein
MHTTQMEQSLLMRKDAGTHREGGPSRWGLDSSLQGCLCSGGVQELLGPKGEQNRSSDAVCNKRHACNRLLKKLARSHCLAAVVPLHGCCC